MSSMLRTAALLMIALLVAALAYCQESESTRAAPSRASAPAMLSGAEESGLSAAEGSEGSALDGGAEPLIDVWRPTETLKQGGVMMFAILICSVLTVTFAFERVVSLRRGRVIPGPFVKRVLGQIRDGQLDRGTALELCDQNGSPIAKVFSGAIRKWGRPVVEIEQGFLDAGERAATRLRKFLRLFHAVSTVCPLLGLLGTVLGVIKSFNSMATADELHRSMLLAQGIAEALLTTAFGLGVAISSLVCYWLFSARADQLVVDIDSLGEELVQLLAGESADVGRGPARRNRREGSAAA